jgi:hypothetical protein
LNTRLSILLHNFDSTRHSHCYVINYVLWQVIRQLEGKSRDMFGGRVYRHRQPSNEQEREWVALYHDGNGKVRAGLFDRIPTIL